MLLWIFAVNQLNTLFRWTIKKAGNVIFLLLASDECVSVSHAGTHVSSFEMPFVSFLAVISSPCRQSVSLLLSPPLV